MIFASDLDRTLIYSKKFITEDIQGVHNIKNIEIYNEEEISFVTEEGIVKLKNIAEKILFVPVTTRTVEQFNRIRFDEHLIDFKYVITSNGGNIIVDGSVDNEYNAKIKREILEGFSIEKMEALFKKELYDEEWVLKYRVADEVFFYCVIDESKAPIEKILAFGKEKVEPNNWRLVKNGRKVYFIPNCVSKGTALKEVSRRIKDNEIISAGDSVLDLDMLEVSNHFLIPRHGELFEHNVVDDRVIHTEKEGLLAGLEIIDFVHNNHI